MASRSLANKYLAGQRRASVFFALVLAAFLPSHPLAASGDEEKIQLTGVPDASVQCYRMTTNVVHIEPDGQRKKREVYTLWIQFTPKKAPEGDLVTCRRFMFRGGDGPEVVIPALKDWSYRLPRAVSGIDERGQLFGIDQSRFEHLVDEKGAALPMDASYMVFNAFVDFHSFGQVFCARVKDGKGIQDLHKIGDKIVHAAANSEAPVHLGSAVEKGSTFKNGEITLELKGMSQADGARCAIVSYDSGDSSFHMILKPMPQISIDVVGGSHYWGDLYVDLDTQWLRKATLSEVVVSETSGAVLPQKMHGVVERALLLESISKDRWESGK
jgi:hypothetical protein